MQPPSHKRQAGSDPHTAGLRGTPETHQTGVMFSAVPAYSASVAVVLMLCVAGPTVGAQNATPVSVIEAQRVTLQDTRRLTGTVTAARVSALSPQVAGLVAAIEVDAGDRVEEGAVVVRLDDEVARLEQRRREAAVAEGRAQLAEAQRVSREIGALADKRSLPATQAEAARASAAISAEVLTRLEAEAELQRATLRRHTLRAPFAGVVAARHADPGEWIAPGEAVIDLVALDSLRFDVRAPQELYAQLQTGDRVSLVLDALPGLSIEGHIGARVPVADTATRSFLLRVALGDPPPTVIPGMSGEALIALKGRQAAWSVPRDAVVSYPDGTRSLWVVEHRDGGEVATARRVRLGRSLDQAVEILDGLSGGERVVLRGNESLREGQAVRVVPDPRS